MSRPKARCLDIGGNLKLVSVATFAFACAIAVTSASAAEARKDAAHKDASRTHPRARHHSEAATISELQKRLDERDALIRDLLRRVERLERRAVAKAQAPEGAAAPLSAQASPATRASAPAAPRAVAAASEAPAQVAQNAPRSAPQAPADAAPPSSAPGQFTVSDEAAQRALERALVQSGAALLPPFKMEFVPSLTYQFQRASLPSQIALTTSGSVLITEDVKRNTQVEAAGLLRMGLPWDLQAEVSVPYEYKHFATASEALGAGLSESTTTATGLGDPTLSLTSQILRESDVRPGLFVNATWDSNLGQTRGVIPLGTGFNELRFGATAVKRQDPLVFTAGLTYQTAFENKSIRPGDQYTPAVGLLFAVSPETSLRFAQQVSFIRGTTASGRSLPGSEQTSGLFSFGLLSILGRGFVLDFTTSVGETRDAPDLSMRLAFPIRLN